MVFVCAEVSVHVCFVVLFLVVVGGSVDINSAVAFVVAAILGVRCSRRRWH